MLRLRSRIARLVLPFIYGRGLDSQPGKMGGGAMEINTVPCFQSADANGVANTSPTEGAWTKPGPTRGPFKVNLADGSTVTYYWYRFVDQPSFQQYSWSEEKKAKLQAFVEKVHAAWTIDKDYMAPLRRGSLATLDPALLVTPPKGLELGYVPIVTHQEATGGQEAAKDKTDKLK